MKVLIILAAVLICFSSLTAQTDLQEMVDAEHAFAQLAADKDTRTAFLANMTSDAVVFVPEQTNAKSFWEAKTPNQSLLSWAPNFADITSSGILGYTTGNWEFRAKGKDDTPSAFGEFITLWLRQPDGKYKWVVDIGVTHQKPDRYSTDWTTATPEKTQKSSTSVPTSNPAEEFYHLVAAKGVTKAYDNFADDNIRSYREGSLPILGKKNVLKLLKNDKAKITFAKRSTAFAAGDIAYNLTSYTKTLDGKIEKGNFLQIWKFYNGKWHIVLDIFKLIP
ncbi:MAG: hypothetical protein IPL32_16620 [Chloracidobacterium sp.]|nr:hypothetical protein [Chloracidobacterium sp.]